VNKVPPTPFALLDVTFWSFFFFVVDLNFFPLCGGIRFEGKFFFFGAAVFSFFDDYEHTFLPPFFPPARGKRSLLLLFLEPLALCWMRALYGFFYPACRKPLFWPVKFVFRCNRHVSLFCFPSSMGFPLASFCAPGFFTVFSVFPPDVAAHVGFFFL